MEPGREKSIDAVDRLFLSMRTDLKEFVVVHFLHFNSRPFPEELAGILAFLIPAPCLKSFSPAPWYSTKELFLCIYTHAPRFVEISALIWDTSNGRLLTVFLQSWPRIASARIPR